MFDIHSRHSDDTEMRLLPRADPRPVHTQGAGAHVARQVSAVQRVSCPAERQVLRPQRPAVLQGGLFQVSVHHQNETTNSDNI